MNLLNNHRYSLILGIVLALLASVVIGGMHINVLGFARWFHIVAGVFWIGLLYYFNVAQTPAMADAARILEEALSLAADQRARIAHEPIESLDGDVGAERALQVEAIRAALIEGEASGIAEDSSLEGILTELRASRAR